MNFEYIKPNLRQDYRALNSNILFNKLHKTIRRSETATHTIYIHKINANARTIF